MSSLALELDRVLRSVDAATASALEREVRNAIANEEQHAGAEVGVDAMGYPIGYFEATAGCFASEPLQAPPELLMQTRDAW